MKKELLWAACISAALGTGVLLLAGGSQPEGMPWQPLNGKLEAALASQEKTAPAEGEASGAEAARGTSGTSGSLKASENDALERAGGETSGKAAGQAAPAQKAAEQAANPKTTASALGAGTAKAGEAQKSAAAGSSETPSVPQAAPEAVSETVPKAEPAPAEDGKIHLNSADAARLMDLPGIGEKKAQAIVDYRTKNGPFRDVTEIVKVKGIGAKMLEKMLPDLAL